jgi:quercetin 2,3-dioxygenase
LFEKAAMTIEASTDSSAIAPNQASAVLHIEPLGFPWVTTDPFLFCAYHDDAYPEGNGEMAPRTSLAGRPIGQDFSRRDGWSMYHGETVPGFPGHPHRGFETVTIVRKGLIDHADSLGAAARFGAGDVQWVTAGRGIVHSEMFPLLDETAANPLELFQIWLNLPAASKMVPPNFTMLWSDSIPRMRMRDGNGLEIEVAVIAGHMEANDSAHGTDKTAAEPPAPPPDSWAARADSDVAIWTIRLAPGARWTLPAAQRPDTHRTLYFFRGTSIEVAGNAIDRHAALTLLPQAAVELHNTGSEPAEFLMLQGRPIGESVAQYGPFVMNTQSEIREAISDYQRTQFGGWPWPDSAPVHGSDPARFAKYPDGRDECPVDQRR